MPWSSQPSNSSGKTTKQSLKKLNAHELNARLNSFYNSALVPIHMRNLLEVYGIFEVEHLLKFTGESAKRIESAIQGGTFARSYIDMASKQEQIRYFGAHIINAGLFEFRMNEMDTLCGLSGLASDFIRDESATVSKKRPRTKRSDFGPAGGPHSSLGSKGSQS